MPSIVLSVIAASYTAIGKMLVLGLVGVFCCKYPKRNPFIPSKMIAMLSRMTFNMLLIPLVYTGLASNIKLDEVSKLYPLIFMSMGVLLSSFTITMSLGYILGFRLSGEKHFIPLCIACTFPNIVALPIIIFPTLCEYGVVQDLVKEDISTEDETMSLMDVCKKQTNAVVFTYFCGQSIILWTVGIRVLLSNKANISVDEEQEMDTTIQHDVSIKKGKCGAMRRFAVSMKDAVLEVITQPTFISLVAGVITGCITPLQKALFDTGGSLRVIGAALEGLSSAATTLLVIVVAASLVAKDDLKEDVNKQRLVVDGQDVDEEIDLKLSNDEDDFSDENKIGESDRRGKLSFGRYFNSLPSRDTLKIHLWQIMSRLIVTPGIIFLVLIRLDCAGLLDFIPNIAKLVILINSAVPGALVIVVVLEAHGFADEAATVSMTYLPTYIISVFTLAMWSTFGLMAFREDSGMC